MSDSLGRSSIDSLATLYVFTDDLARERVARFIEQHAALPSILSEARAALLDLYPRGIFRLDVTRNPDSGDEQLVLSIGIERDPASPRDAVRRLLALQDAWGIDADRRAGGRITIVLESIGGPGR